MSNFPKKKKVVPLGWVLTGVGIIFFVFYLAVLHARHIAMWPGAPATSNSAPSSVRPSNREVVNYKVAPHSPRYITIPVIKVDKTRIIKLSSAKNGQILSPNNIYDAGWYSGSSYPGENGVVFIYGHISSWTSKGIFYDLNKLKPNDKIIITRGDGRIFVYKVVLTRLYQHDKVNMLEVLSPFNSSEQGLNIMTCAGHIIKGSNEFSERLVVFANLVKN